MKTDEVLTKTQKKSSEIQPSEIEVIERFIEDNNVVFDVGAHIGAWTKEVLRRCPDIEVHLFEPVTQTYPTLLQNLTNSIKSGKVFINNYAIAQKEEIRKFYYYEESPSWSTFYRRFDVEKQYNLKPPKEFSVFTTTLDNYAQMIGINRINFLKIDVEGGELEVFYGGDELLRKGKIDYIQFEYGGTFLDARITLGEMFEYLRHMRYEIYKLLPGVLEHMKQFLPSYENFEYNHFLAVNERFRSNVLGEAPKMLDIPYLLSQYSITPRGIVHVGAHEGREIERYQIMGVRNVLFIEANPVVFEQLKKNIGKISNIQAVNYAISNHDNTVVLHVMSMDQSSSILPLKRHKEIYPDIKETHKITVQSRSLDTLLEELQLLPSDFNFLNIDIQGAELLALQGAKNLLKHIEAINTEVNYEELYEGCALIDQLDEFLEEYGFERVATTTPYNPSWGDALYIKKPVITMSTLGTNGRFGNQIFQYAFLKIYAKEHNLRIETPAWIGQYLFGHNDPPIFRQLPEVRQDTHSLSESIIPNAREPFKNVDFWGYFQYHTKYYAPYKEYFRLLFKPVPEVETKMKAALERLRSRGKTIIGIHLRRGDYIYDRPSHVAPNEWYKEWLNGLWETLDEPVLFIASDEPENVLADFVEYNPVTVKDLEVKLPEADYYPDFYLLSKCDIVAISNSIFSFATCMLNEQSKIFFRPHLQTKKLIPFDPWNSEPLLRDIYVI